MKMMQIGVMRQTKMLNFWVKFEFEAWAPKQWIFSWKFTVKLPRLWDRSLKFLANDAKHYEYGFNGWKKRVFFGVFLNQNLHLKIWRKILFEIWFFSLFYCPGFVFWPQSNSMGSASSKAFYLFMIKEGLFLILKWKLKFFVFLWI